MEATITPMSTSQAPGAAKINPTVELHSTWHFPPYQLPCYPSSHLLELLGSNQEEAVPADRSGPILIVEDDPDILSSVADILDFEGYKVVTATDGATGLDLLEKSQPSLILLDMRMPVLNGWDFARIMKERGYDVPVLVMTAAQDARRWADEIGAVGYIPKPFHIIDLLDAVERFRPSGRQ